MIVEAQVTVAGSRPAIWALVSDIANGAQFIRGIEKIEVVEKAARGLVGLRWRETRILFGKPATVEKQVTQAVENESYETRAESDGFVFLTTLRLAQDGGGCTVISTHDSRPQTLRAKIMTVPMGLFFKCVIRKAILQDLNDIKSAVEKR